MLKALSFGKNQAGILITLMVLLSLGACYFFFYLPGNEKNVQERRFRCLRKIDVSIRSKISTSETQITNLLNSYDNYSQHNNGAELNKLRKYIREYSKANFTLLLPEQADKYFYKDSSLVYTGDDTSGTVKYFIDADSHFTLLAKKVVPGNQPSVHKKTTDTLAIGIRFEFDQFIQPLLLTDVFDHYIAFINKKKIFEDYPTGLTFDNPDSLLNVKNKITTPGLRSIQIGETDYKVFSQPVYTYTNNKWIITGLLRNSEYQQEKNQLPLWALLLLITVAVTMLVSLPWIKLYHMGNKDRLTTVDGIESLLVAMVLMSLLFFVFFKYRIDLKTNLLPYSFSKAKGSVLFSGDSYSRDVLATKITNAFEGEVNLGYNLLSSFDAIHNDGDKSVSLLGKGTSKYDTLFKKYANSISLKQVYWMDHHGSEKTNLTIDSNNDPKGHYNERNYFKLANSYKMSDHRFFLDQIFSFTTGTFRSVISKKTEAGVVAMSLTMQSVDKILLPDGYQFAIINSAAQVLYHTKTNRNLFENFYIEFADSKDLLSCIQAKSDTSFEAEYYGKMYNVKIKPMPNLPYFTMIFEDREYNDMRDTEAYTFTFFMLTCMLLFISIKYGIVFFVSSTYSYFKKQHFDTSWLGPHIKSHHQYNLAILANLLTILMLMTFFNNSSFLEYLYMLLVSTLFTSAFLNLLFAIRYKKSDDNKYKLKKAAAMCLCGFIVIINLAACFTIPGHIITLLFFELMLVVIYPVILFGGQLLLTSIRKYKHGLFSWTYTHSYAMMAATQLIISSGIPVAFFFIYSFNHEQNLDTQYRQLNFARSLERRIQFTGTDTIAENKKLEDLKNNVDRTSGIYFDGLLIDTIKVGTMPAIPFSGEDLLTAKILNVLRIKINNLEAENNNLNLSSVDSSAYFSSLNRQCGDNSPTQTFYKIAKSRFLKISSRSHFNYSSTHFLFWVALLVSILAFYYIIHQIIRKLFALNLYNTSGWGRLDNELLKDNAFNKFVLIVGAPGADTLLKLKNKIRNHKIKDGSGQPLVFDENDPSKNNVFIADMMMISAETGEFDKEWKKHKEKALGGNSLVIINHFEYNIKDALTNKIKLDLLELLMEQNTNKIFIISTVLPLSFLDSFSEKQNLTPESELMRWHTLLTNFNVVIDPFIKSGVSDTAEMPKKAIMEETRYSRFLHSKQKISLKFWDKQRQRSQQQEETRGQITDSLIFKLQLTSQYFYTGIWQSLTREEKFILYDLAEDGLVNSYDDFNLSILICKGLIVRHDGVLKLFNRSFRNFILTAIGEKEISRIKDQVKDNGNWGNLKTPINIAILAILAFLFASQQEAYSRVITYITAFGAAIPSIFKIFSMFGTSSGTQKTE